MTIPLSHLDEALAGFRRRLWAASLVILVLAGGISLFWFRALTARIHALVSVGVLSPKGDFLALL